MSRPRIREKPTFKQAFGTIKRLLAYAGATNRLRLVIIFLCITINAVAYIIGTLFLRDLIDKYIVPLLGSAVPDFGELLRAVLRMAAIYLCGIIATMIFNRLVLVTAQTVLKRIRDDMFAHLQTLPIKYFDTNLHGDIMSYFTNDTDTLRMFMTQGIPQIFNALITVLFAGVTMIATSLALSAVVAIFVAGTFIIIKVIGGKSSTHFVKMQMDIGIANGYAEEMLNGQKVIKVFCHEDKVVERYAVLCDTLYDDAYKANTYASTMMPTIMTLGMIQYIIVAFVGSLLTVLGIGGLSVGTIAACMQLSRSFTLPIGQVSQQLNSIIMALAGAQRIFNMLDETPDADNGYVTLVNAKLGSDGESILEADTHTGIWAWKNPDHDGKLTYTRLMGDVRFVDVDFQYVENKPVLNDVSLFAKPGQKIALVGPTGAGKTTITNLLTRFYDIESGQILYDGIDIRKIRKPDLRHSLGLVLQDTSLFTGTIMENIRYGRLDATDEEIYEAARLANADGFIKMLPDGYDTYIEEGSTNLSQGQRQLISIARAAVANPPVMILDEATSSIDTRTESLVQNGMDKLMLDRTVFVIAHRLSTIRNAKAILVIDDGRIIERGDHAELLEQKGKYYSLYTGDFELE